MKLLFAVSSFLILLSMQAFAALTFNASATSDYVSRGISASLNNPAVQGGADLKLESGPLLGVWTSTLGDNTNGQEIDIYAGCEKELVQDLTGGIKFIGYQYLKATDKNYLEANVSLVYKAFTLNVYHAPSISSAIVVTEKFSSTYLNVASFVQIQNDVKLNFALGASSFSDEKLADLKNYVDGYLSLSKTVQNNTISINLTETNRKNALEEKQKDLSFFVTASIAY